MYSQSSSKNYKQTKIQINIKNKINKGRDLQIELFEWATVYELKNKIYQKLSISENHQRLFYKSQPLNQNNSMISSYDIKNMSQIILQTDQDLEQSLGIIDPYDIFTKPCKKIEKALQDVEKAFLQRIKPKLTDSGTSGSYFLESIDKKIIAIFKPVDEEAYAPNNPRGYQGKLGQQGFRQGILSGESASREVAAYLIDQKQKMHGVPPTTFVDFYHPSFVNNQQIQQNALRQSNTLQQKALQNIKQGSFQIFAKHDDAAENFGCNIFPTEQVHKIAILDIIILNCDRNDQNILVQKKRIKDNVDHQYQQQRNNSNSPNAKITQTKSTGNKQEYQYKLIPIDHGLSFPDCFQICSYELAWMDWPQSQQPFSIEELNYIQKLDPIQIQKMLSSKLKFRPICLRNARIAQTLLKKAASKGLTLYDIGQILYKEDYDEQSEIEKIVYMAEDMIKKIGFANMQKREITSYTKKVGFMKQTQNDEEEKKGLIVEEQAEEELDEDNESEEEKKEVPGSKQNRQEPPVEEEKLNDLPKKVNNTNGIIKIPSEKLTKQLSYEKNCSQNQSHLITQPSIKLSISSEECVSPLTPLALKKDSQQNIISKDSIQSPKKLKHALSLPNLSILESKESTQSNQDSQETQSINSNNPSNQYQVSPQKLIKTQSFCRTKDKEGADQDYQQFFHYLESLLDTLIDKKVKAKRPKRDRFLSTDIEKD